jgi:hypothetical protein
MTSWPHGALHRVYGRIAAGKSTRTARPGQEPAVTVTEADFDLLARYIVAPEEGFDPIVHRPGAEASPAGPRGPLSHSSPPKLCVATISWPARSATG